MFTPEAKYDDRIVTEDDMVTVNAGNDDTKETAVTVSIDKEFIQCYPSNKFIYI